MRKYNIYFPYNNFGNVLQKLKILKKKNYFTKILVLIFHFKNYLKIKLIIMFSIFLLVLINLNRSYNLNNKIKRQKIKNMKII